MPRFLYEYAEGGANTEQTLRHNTEDLAAISLRQKVLPGNGTPELKAILFAREQSLSCSIAGMFRQRGEVQAARAAASAGIPFCLSTVGIC